MGTKRVQKTRTVQRQRWNSSIGGYEAVSVPETYWDTEYVSDSYSSPSYDSSSYSSDSSASGGSGD